MLAGAERQFALSPKYMLMLFLREFVKRHEDKECGIITLTDQKVREHNFLQVAQCLTF